MKDKINKKIFMKKLENKIKIKINKYNKTKFQTIINKNKKKHKIDLIEIIVIFFPIFCLFIFEILKHYVCIKFFYK